MEVNVRTVNVNVFTTISMCNTTQLYYRVLQVAKQETENSEDPGYINRVGEASDNMASTVPHMVDSAKSLAKNITHPGLLADWRKNNRAVSHLKIEIFVTVVRNHLKIFFIMFHKTLLIFLIFKMDYCVKVSNT